VIKAIYRNPYRQVTIDTLNRLVATMDVPAINLFEEVTKEQAEREMEQAPKKIAPKAFFQRSSFRSILNASQLYTTGSIPHCMENEPQRPTVKVNVSWLLL
jgi:hypothetical protein